MGTVYQSITPTSCLQEMYQGAVSGSCDWLISPSENILSSLVVAPPSLSYLTANRVCACVVCQCVCVYVCMNSLTGLTGFGPGERGDREKKGGRRMKGEGERGGELMEKNKEGGGQRERGKYGAPHPLLRFWFMVISVMVIISCHRSAPTC